MAHKEGNSILVRVAKLLRLSIYQNLRQFTQIFWLLFIIFKSRSQDHKIIWASK